MYLKEVYGTKGTYAKVVADSVSPNGTRLTTLQLKYPRFIHSEFMTHRMFSRNASSSRAIPVKKMLQNIKECPATPIFWGRNQPGMQAEEENNAPVYIDGDLYPREEAWHMAAKSAIYYASEFDKAGYHKQIVNRITEPFQFINVVVTATEWENFFKLRMHKDAQPEIQDLAVCMYQAMKLSTPMPLEVNEWHLPYITDKDNYSLEDLIKASVARCARVSYLKHDNSTPNIEEDIRLHNRLLDAAHMSPFEHIATPLSGEKGLTSIDRDGVTWSNNFRNWAQYRAMLD